SRCYPASSAAQTLSTQGEHGAEEGRHVDRGIERLATELAVRALDLEDDALRLGPSCVGTQVDPPGRFECGQPRREEASRFRPHVLEVGLHLLRALDPAEGTMARHDDVRVERDDRVQGGGPARERPFPADWRAVPEKNVARVDDALGGPL